MLAKFPSDEQKAVTRFWADVVKAPEPVNNTGSLKSFHRNRQARDCLLQ
jgi:hypothetical protein